MRPRPCPNCGALYRPQQGHTCLTQSAWRDVLVASCCVLAAMCAAAAVTCGALWAVGVWR